MTKQSFAITTNVVTHIWGPTTIRISGDESVAGQIRPTEGGGVEFDFPERLVLVANHQVRDEQGQGVQVKLTVVDLHRLALPVVGSVREPTGPSWAHIHHPQRVTQAHPLYRLGHEVLQLHLHVEEDGH